MSPPQEKRSPQTLVALAALLAGLVLVTLLVVGGGGPRGGPGAGLGQGMPMPEFTLASLGGSPVSKRDFAGRVVLFDFWATWCGPCHLQADVLRAIYPRQAGRGVEFVAVATGEETSTVREFVARNPFPYPVVSDPEERVGGQLEINALPTLVIMDRAGRIVFRHVGYADAETLERALAEAGAS